MEGQFHWPRLDLHRCNKKMYLKKTVDLTLKAILTYIIVCVVSEYHASELKFFAVLFFVSYLSVCLFGMETSCSFMYFQGT